MELLFERSLNDIRQFARNKTSRYGRSPKMNFVPVKSEATPTTRAIKQGFISEELMTRYCKLVGHKYPDHICSKCNQGDEIIPEVFLE